MKLLNAQFLGFNIESWDPIIVAAIITLAILAVISLIKGLLIVLVILEPVLINHLLLKLSAIMKMMRL